MYAINNKELKNENVSYFRLKYDSSVFKITTVDSFALCGQDLNQLRELVTWDAFRLIDQMLFSIIARFDKFTLVIHIDKKCLSKKRGKKQPILSKIQN